MALLKQSTIYTRAFLLVQTADHLSGLTGASPTVNLSKAGGAFGAAGGTVTEIANGFYKIALTTTDTNTIGDLAFHITATSGDATDFVDQITAAVDQSGDNFARLGAPTGASVSADIAAAKVDTAAIKVQTDKLTFTVANKVDANVLNLNGDATSAANIAKTTRAIARATASGVPTTTSIPTSACTPAGAVADQFKARIITFDADTTTTALRGQATDITASSNAATPTFTVTALTTSPVSGDTFSIT